ncbi:MAG: hypothetical protein ABI646_08760, partial [Acidobacteriota bacterium]
MQKTARTIWFTLVVLLLSSVVLAQRSVPAVERRINQLVAKMTLAEKLGQLQQLDGDSSGFARPEHFDLARKGLLGSTLNVRGVKF